MKLSFWKTTITHPARTLVSWLRQETRPPADHSGRPEYDHSIEGLRGLLALVVFLDHVVQSKSWLRAPEIDWVIFNSGSSAVLGFFALSGYVIGLTNTAQFSPALGRDYLSRRSLRLLPIYLIAVFCGLWATRLMGATASWRDVAGYLLFIQDFSGVALSGNGPLWSLSYEVLYYLLFLLIWWLRPTRGTLLAAVTVLVAASLAPVFPQQVASLFVGLYFWIAGLLLAWTPRAYPCAISPWGILVLVGVIHNLQPGVILFRGLGLLELLHDGYRIPLSVAVQLLPAFILLIGTLAGRISRKTAMMLASVVWLTAASGVVQYGRVVGFDEAKTVLLAAACLVSIPLMVPSTVGHQILCRFAPLGRISYAFYVLHMPVIIAVGTYLPVSAPFAVRLVVATVFSIGLSIILETKLQPRIRRFFSAPQATSCASPS